MLLQVKLMVILPGLGVLVLRRGDVKEGRTKSTTANWQLRAGYPVRAGIFTITIIILISKFGFPRLSI